MKPIILIAICLTVFSKLIFAQNQLNYNSYSSRIYETDPLVCYDSTHNFYKAGNNTSASQISAIWTGNDTELLLEPNFELNLIVRTKADSIVRYRKGNMVTDTLEPIYSSANFYESGYNRLLKQNIYGYYNGFISLSTADYYYGTTVDSAIFRGGTPQGPLTNSFIRYFYKTAGGRYDSIVDRFFNNGNLGKDIKWTFMYNSQNELTEWKFINPNYPISNRLYKLFYNSNGNRIDSIQLSKGLPFSYANTYKYEYDNNNKWNKFTNVQSNLPPNYPNKVANFKNINWGNEDYCDEITNNIYNTFSNNYEIYSIDDVDFNSSGYVEKISGKIPLWSNKLGNKVIYNYSLGTGIDVSKETNFTIYPNPSNGKFTIELADYVGFTKLIITDLLGSIIKTETIIGQTKQISLELNSGLYFVSLEYKNKRVTQKIIVN